MKKIIIAAWIIILLSFVIAAGFYGRMPDKMASHWNMQGNVNGYIPKFWGLFLMPIIAIAMLLLFLFIPAIDPLNKNFRKFRKYYDLFILLIILFMFYIYIFSLLWNLNFRFNMGQIILPALGLLLFYAGILMENSKRNWFVGIRTPWTLSSEKVWDKTNRLGGRLFKISGAIAIAGALFQKEPYSFLIALLPVIISSIYLLFYSYLEYKKLQKK